MHALHLHQPLDRPDRDRVVRDWGWAERYREGEQVRVSLTVLPPDTAPGTARLLRVRKDLPWTVAGLMLLALPVLTLASTPLIALLTASALIALATLGIRAVTAAAQAGAHVLDPRRCGGLADLVALRASRILDELQAPGHVDPATQHARWQRAYSDSQDADAVPAHRELCLD